MKQVNKNKNVLPSSKLLATHQVKDDTKKDGVMNDRSIKKEAE